MSIRVLHVVSALRPAGVETWLLHVLRHIDRNRFHIDFLAKSHGTSEFADQFRALGSTVVEGAGNKPRRVFARNFARMLSLHGPYDVVHSHLHFYNGLVMRLAALHGVPVRIAHNHSYTSTKEMGAGALKRNYYWRMRRRVARHATAGLTASRRAAPSLFGPDWQGDSRWRVLYCGIDLTPFRAPVDRRAVRNALGLPADCLVIGHVGRFHPPKNHAFLLSVFAEIVKRAPSTRLLLVGDGPLRAEIEQRTAASGFSEEIVFAGLRLDVARLMTGAMDFFLLPSLWEGLPLVLMEAQAAGLPCIVSDAVPDEANVVPGLIRRLPLDAPVAAWAHAVLHAHRSTTASRTAALQRVEESPFNIGQSVAALERFYESQIARQSQKGAETPIDPLSDP